MNKNLLFTRKFNKEEYKFYMNTTRDFNGLFYDYISIETPENCFGYPDTILFNSGIPYTLHRYCPAWILKACKDAVIKKGYKSWIL